TGCSSRTHVFSFLTVSLPGALRPLEPCPATTSACHNTAVGLCTSAAVGSILSCDIVPITSGCCNLSGMSSCYGGQRCLPC
ncbi:KRFB protein, partial [Heliornis fulica]|nr:KRFB protein [Heliornis fulica]